MSYSGVVVVPSFCSRVDFPRSLRRSVGMIAALLCLGAIGCGGPKTGDVAKEAPGQAAGEAASEEHMLNMMKQQQTKRGS